MIYQVLQTLGTEASAPSSAAQCVAYIGCIELPHGEWPDLLPTLLRNITVPGSTDSLKESSLEAIGYVCEETTASVSWSPLMLQVYFGILAKT